MVIVKQRHSQNTSGVFSYFLMHCILYLERHSAQRLVFYLKRWVIGFFHKVKNHIGLHILICTRHKLHKAAWLKVNALSQLCVKSKFPQFLFTPGCLLCAQTTVMLSTLSEVSTEMGERSHTVDFFFSPSSPLLNVNQMCAPELCPLPLPHSLSLPLLFPTPPSSHLLFPSSLKVLCVRVPPTYRLRPRLEGWTVHCCSCPCWLWLDRCSLKLHVRPMTTFVSHTHTCTHLGGH